MPHLNINIRIVSNAENEISYNLTNKIELSIWDCIRNKAKDKGIKIDFYYGSSNQRYCIIVIDNGQNVQKVMNKIKNMDNYFLNKQDVCGKSFSTELSVISGEMTTYELEWKSNIYVMKVNDTVFDRISNQTQNELQINNKKTLEAINNEYLIQYSFDKI